MPAHICGIVSARPSDVVSVHPSGTVSAHPSGTVCVCVCLCVCMSAHPSGTVSAQSLMVPNMDFGSASNIANFVIQQV